MPALLFLLNALCYAGQSATGKQYAARGGASQSFYLSKSVSAFILFALWILIAGKGIHFATAPYALVYGVCLTVSMHAGFIALSCGPMALTSIMAAMSLMIPFLWGLIFWQEQVTLLSGIGVFLLLGAVILIHYRKQGSISRKWLCYSMMTMVMNGACSVIQKYHQMAFPGMHQGDFMFCAMAVVFIFFLCKAVKKDHGPLGFSLLGACSGVLNGLANLIILVLAAEQTASGLFPLISAGNVIAAWLTGILFFRDQIRKFQLLGLFLGISGIIFMNL